MLLETYEFLDEAQANRYLAGSWVLVHGRMVHVLEASNLDKSITTVSEDKVPFSDVNIVFNLGMVTFDRSEFEKGTKITVFVYRKTERQWKVGLTSTNTACQAVGLADDDFSSVGHIIRREEFLRTLRGEYTPYSEVVDWAERPNSYGTAAFSRNFAVSAPSKLIYYRDRVMPIGCIGEDGEPLLSPDCHVLGDLLMEDINAAR